MVKASASKKRKHAPKDDFFVEEEDQAGFLDSEDEQKRKDEDSESEEEEIEETAEEKRLRLAKAYLDRLKHTADSDEDDGAGLDREAITARLKEDALDALGHLRRQIAHRVTVPPLPKISNYDPSNTPSKLFRGHKLSVTATALTHDDAQVFSVSKDGSVFCHDIETGTRHRLGFDSGAAKDLRTTNTASGGADWVTPAARQASQGALLAAAVSSDGRYFVAGGGDKKLHLWDARTRHYIRSFPGHKDAVTALAFREGTNQLYSGSLDRSIKIWSLEDMAYVDTLFGHQSEILGLDALRAERVLSCAADRTCRVWKVPEESQLIYRAHCLTMDCCSYITGGEWVTGSADGCIQLWGAARKKPLMTVRGAHFDPNPSLSALQYPAPGQTPTTTNGTHLIEQDTPTEEEEQGEGAGSVGGTAASWVTSLAVCRGSDLLASGAGDGVVRLWRVATADDKASGGKGHKALTEIGGLPIRGFVNSLHIARSGKFVVAGVGQEPRMGRWLRDGKAKNGVVVWPLDLVDEESDDE